MITLVAVAMLSASAEPVAVPTSAALSIKAPNGQSVRRPQFLIHVMPWFVLDEKTVGWHWKMNRPDDQARKGDIASHFHPLIGPYDSNDPALLDLQVGWMKLAGFDGLLADWYGINRHFDYPEIHARTESLFKKAEQAGLKIGVVYEDQSIGNAIRAKLLPGDSAKTEAEKVGRFLAQNWLKRPSWLRLGSNPTVMVFGPQTFQAADWQAFRQGTGPIDLLTLHEPRPVGNGVYDWPNPSRGLAFNREFPKRSTGQTLAVPVAYPRFQDFYAQGGQKGYEILPDDDGRTLTLTLADALRQNSLAIQVATWNDWQEGTQIEPSKEFGLRDLIAIQRARSQIDPKFPFTAKDLDMPLRLFRVRKRHAVTSPQSKATAEKAAKAILTGDLLTARRLISKMESPP